MQYRLIFRTVYDVPTVETLYTEKEYSVFELLGVAQKLKEKYPSLELSLKKIEKVEDLWHEDNL